MFRRMDPKIVCITTASLLNTTDTDGLFKGYLDKFDLIICDEASQVPEPVFMAMAARIPRARHIYIGDIHQLEPYARSSRLSNPARLGAQSIMNVLQRARAVPMRSLITTFRAHPALIDLPNTLCYEGSLVSGVTAADRHQLLDIMDFPNPHLPFMFVDVNGTSVQSASHSHYNEREKMVCEFLVTTLVRKGVAPSDIVVITFYKDQYRRLEEFVTRVGVNLSTVDTVQGREKNVVIVLTTKTHFNPEGAEFLGDPRRMNVALTRCRHGQFLLGHQESLEKVPFWRMALEWARNQNAIVPSTSLGRYLRA
ncbi:unnamed protein product [Cylicocyclus nassatus]|uniref:DNA2/NAM7 helicase-like C-terminal domain-containing protein n=1 Tax=Cylicocyclus nassatus TaxID=53992 RepID=A0AA36DKA5_CYLNA|nr:unnamed protein product [Cylicocyclus nassatus]